jgi:V/A-type H+-transporting ATPase subunit F
MKRILVVTHADSTGGFAIAGVGQREPDASGAAAVIDDAVADDDVGVLAIDERLIDAALQQRTRELERRWRGVCVVLPAPGKPDRPEDDYARRLIRRAIGYQVKVQL